MTRAYSLTVNGQTYAVAAAPGDTLLDVLRDKLWLTGTKKGCNVGDCGACTVLIDGEAMNSCLLLAGEVEGRTITTIEGVATNGGLSPIQKAFVREGAIQCGFCTPGMILSATALLERNPSPDTDEIKDALAGNLCRCTGYSGILRAMHRCDNYRSDGTCANKESPRAACFSPRDDSEPSTRSACFSPRGHSDVDHDALSADEHHQGESPSESACAGPRGLKPAAQEEKSVHSRGLKPTAREENPVARDPRFDNIAISIPRVDAADKVTGRAIYTADISLPNMVHGKILGSTIAHGIVKRIDTSKAEALPGVLAVITGKDVPDTMYGVSPARYDEYVLAKDKVRHYGDEVAAVAAIDEKTAERAIRLIEVEYEELPVVLDPYEAIKDGAPQIHERYKNNVNTHVDQSFGDVDKAFAESHHVREETFTGNHIYQSPLEPHAAIATWDHDGTLVVYTSTQVPHYVQYMMAHVFHMPLGKIRVIRPCVGGGFGGKAETTPLDLCAVILSKRLGRPVKMCYSREEMFLHGRGRHKQHMKFKLGVDAEGRITAFKSEIYLDGGAYSSFGVATAYYAGSVVPTLYHIPNYKYDGYRMMTNKPAAGAMRGHGVPQPRFAFECLLSMIADDLGIDPVDIRRRNAMDPDTMTVNEMDVGSCEFKATLEATAEKSRWDAKYGKLPRGKGIGIGCGGFVSGAGYCIYRGQVQMSHEKPREHFQKRSIFPHANAIVKISEDGMAAVLMIGAAEIGQGSDTVLTQMCAEGLGIPASRVRIRSEDSDISPLDLGSYSSRVTLMAGHAVSRAGFAVVDKMKPYAAALLGCDESEAVARAGKFYVTRAACFSPRDDSQPTPRAAGVSPRGDTDGHGRSPTAPRPEIDESRSVAWEEVARKYFNDNGPLVATGCYKPPDGLGGDYKGSTVGTSPAYSFGTAVCEVSVDMDTGKVKIDKFTDYHDCGTPINPLAVHGQVEGAVVMGASETILEDVQFDEKGRILNPNLHGYLMMTIKDAPEIFSGLVDSYEPRGPFGAKEIGEGSTLPVLGAVAHAIANATGVWIKDLPITPEKILKALAGKKQTRAPVSV
ncbi:MAG: molybdopterin-dependent oxidoreductase [Planctomycetes bacterium]|nr:molybdopterin-dependent oxidoreductase [Planctomycetota bacterium]